MSQTPPAFLKAWESECVKLWGRVSIENKLEIKS